MSRRVEDTLATDLRKLFEQAVSSPAPISPLVFDEVYSVGRRRHRRRIATACGAAAIAVVAVAGLVTNMAAAPRSVHGSTSAGQTGAASSLPHSGEPPLWVGAADPDHLYLSFLACTSSPCDKTNVGIAGSDDGGRTWTDRTGPAAALKAKTLAVLGPRTVIAVSWSGAYPELDHHGETVMISTDAARTWSAPNRSAVPVAAVPDDGAALCLSLTAGAGQCALQVIDPATRTLAPLAHQPPLALSAQATGPATALMSVGGHMWVAGTIRGTGWPAVATSADAGRTWQTYAPVRCSSPNCGPPDLATADGRAAYAVFYDSGQQRRLVYRIAADAGLQEVPAAQVVPYDRATGGARSFVTSDGTHVLCELKAITTIDLDECRFWARREGASAYQPATLVGLPSTVSPIRRTPTGWYYTRSYYPEDAIYGSSDGWHWSRVAG